MSSKVSSIEYDLKGNVKNIIGYQNSDGSFKYDNLEGYEYVEKRFDTFTTEGANKVLSGYKITRWAQFPDNQKAILPAILQELLAARKSTKKQMEKETDPFKKIFMINVS
jgi:DNA polymerase elongation subunit (family B)